MNGHRFGVCCRAGDGKSEMSMSHCHMCVVLVANVAVVLFAALLRGMQYLVTRRICCCAGEAESSLNCWHGEWCEYESCKPNGLILTFVMNATASFD